MGFIQFVDILKTYITGNEEVHALDGVSLTIEQGEFAAIMGPSGSGKSTLLAILGGLQHPTGGTMLVDAINIYNLSAERRADFRREYIGFIFQAFQLIPYLTVLENVMLPLATTSLRRSEQKARALAILDRVGLSAKARRLPAEMSGGEQQRAAIARALVNHPPVILADEPTGNLDSATGAEVMRLLQSFHEEARTVIMITHNPENLTFVNRCMYLRDGRVTRAPVERRSVNGQDILLLSSPSAE